MKKTWQVKKFRDCANLIKSPYTPTTMEELPYIGLEHISQQTLRLLDVGKSSETISMKYRFKAGDILFGKLRPYFRKVIMPDFDGVCSTDIMIVRPKEEIDSGFLYYWMASKGFIDAVSKASEGTKMPRAKWDFMENIEKEVPSLLEQRSIAQILSNIDSKIKINSRMNNTLETISSTIFHHWFLDFEFPEYNGRSYKSNGGEMVNSKLGRIPKDWRIDTLGKECKVTMGMSPESKYYNNQGKGLPFHQGVTYFGTRFPDHRTFCTTKGKEANQGDILFSVRAPVGRINVADRKIILGRGLASIRHNKNFQSFMLYQLKQKFIKENSIGDGTVFPAVTKQELEDIKLICPPDNVIEFFNDITTPCDELILFNETQSLILSKIRDLLLPKLLSREIKIS